MSKTKKLQTYFIKDGKKKSRIRVYKNCMFIDNTFNFEYHNEDGSMMQHEDIDNAPGIEGVKYRWYDEKDPNIACCKHWNDSIDMINSIKMPPRLQAIMDADNKKLSDYLVNTKRTTKHEL